MTRQHRSIPLLLAFLLTATAAWAAIPLKTVTGTLDTIWGDSPDGDTYQRWFLTDDQGASIELMVEQLPPRGFAEWNRQRAEVTFEDDPLLSGPKRVRAVRLVDVGENNLRADGSAPISGSKPWVSILCKFSDIAAEPENLSFFQNMYGNNPGQLDHYWREVSYGAIDVVGSTAIAWVDLPRPQTGYIPTPGSGSNANLSLLFNECTAAADPFVDFSNGGSPFEGINMMFNGVLDCCAWGGSRFATLDGTSRSWRTTWEPPWGYRDAGVIAHEMGHGFGLPHSNNSDGDSNPYDSPWDVMSAAVAYSISDATYGRLGKHTVSYHKDRLDWIPANKIYTADSDGQHVVTVDDLAQATVSNYRMIKIPLGGNVLYTVEVRDRTGGYDGNVPGRAVIIHHVDPARAADAEVIDGDSPAANFADTEGVMWKVGETFEDSGNEITVRVDSSTADGFRVTVTRGSATDIFADGFESGNTSAWSDSQS
ncbi:MAG: hypothetical protein AAF604_19745 [Acidobacteriota bacterium]